MIVTKDKITLTEAELLELLKEAWWRGHSESRYSPNLSGSANSSCKEIIRDNKQ